MASSQGRIAVPPLTAAMYRRGVANAKKDMPFDVVRARFDRTHDALELAFRNGTMIRFPRLQIWEIASADPADLRKVEIQPGGDGISIRKVDVDIYVPGLLADELGSLFSKAMGRRTRGKSTTKKAATSRENGRKGGRPKISPAAA